jgi:hypothetical protein
MIQLGERKEPSGATNYPAVEEEYPF